MSQYNHLHRPHRKHFVVDLRLRKLLCKLVPGYAGELRDIYGSNAQPPVEHERASCLRCGASMDCASVGSSCTTKAPLVEVESNPHARSRSPMHPRQEELKLRHGSGWGLSGAEGIRKSKARCAKPKCPIKSSPISDMYHAIHVDIAKNCPEAFPAMRRSQRCPMQAPAFLVEILWPRARTRHNVPRNKEESAISLITKAR